MEETEFIKGVENTGRTITKISETEGQCTHEIRAKSYEERHVQRSNELLEVKNDRISEKKNNRRVRS